MPDPAAPNPLPTKHQKGPNFPLVVALSGVAFLLFFVGALLILTRYGRHLLPHQQRNQPHVYLQQLLPRDARSPVPTPA